MKKTIMVLFMALLLASCAQQAEEVPEKSEISETGIVSEVSREESKEVSKENSEVSKEIKKESSVEVSEESEISEISAEVADYSKQLVEKAVNTDKLGKKTKAYLINVLESKNLYMDITGEFAVFGGIGIKFNAEVGRSDGGVTERFTFGDNSVKILQNGDGTYIIDDINKTAKITGEAYDSGEKLQTFDGYTQNSVANEIISSVSASFGLNTIEYAKSGTEDYRDTKYSFEEYNADGKTVKVYFDGDKPVYITSEDESGNNSVIEINAFTTEPDEEIFRVPDGYEIVQ